MDSASVAANYQSRLLNAVDGQHSQ